MEHDNLNPRRPVNDPTRDGVRDASWRRESEGSGWLWPVIGLGVLLIAGLLFFSNMGNDRPSGQVSQNVERSAPATPKPAAPSNTTAPTTAPK